MIDGEELEETITTVTTMNTNEIGRQNDLGMTCHLALSLLAAPLLAGHPLVGDLRLAHARGRALWLARGQHPLRARPQPRLRRNQRTVYLPGETRALQMSLRVITVNEGMDSPHVVAVAVGVVVAAEIGEVPTGMTAMTGEAADMTDLRGKDTDVGKRVTMLPLPTSTDRSRLAQRTRRGLARLIRRLARRMHDEVHLSELNRYKKVIRCPVPIQPSSSHCMGRSHLHPCERNRLRHCLWLRKRT